MNIDNVKVGSADIAPSPQVTNLGVWFDLNLSMSVHITKICSTAFYDLFNIRKIRKYLPKECTETLIHAFISCKLDYCNSLLYGAPNYILQKCNASKTLRRARSFRM